LLTYWTQKEAYLKALGVGLKDKLDSVDCAQIERETDWTFLSFHVTDNFLGTLCVQGRPLRLRFYTITVP